MKSQRVTSQIPALLSPRLEKAEGGGTTDSLGLWAGWARLRALSCCPCSSTRMWLSPSGEMSSPLILSSELAERSNLGSDTLVGVGGPGKGYDEKGSRDRKRVACRNLG